MLNICGYYYPSDKGHFVDSAILWRQYPSLWGDFPPETHVFNIFYVKYYNNLQEKQYEMCLVSSWNPMQVGVQAWGIQVWVCSCMASKLEQCSKITEKKFDLVVVKLAIGHASKHELHSSQGERMCDLCTWTRECMYICMNMCMHACVHSCRLCVHKCTLSLHPATYIQKPTLILDGIGGKCS